MRALVASDPDTRTDASSGEIVVAYFTSRRLTTSARTTETSRNVAEDRQLPSVEQHAHRQAAALVNQQRQYRSAREAEHAAADAADRDADEQRASHQLPRDAAQSHQAERPALVQHQQAREVRREHPRHPQQRQRDQQRDDADQARDVLHAIEQHFGRAVDHEVGRPPNLSSSSPTSPGSCSLAPP